MKSFAIFDGNNVNIQLRIIISLDFKLYDSNMVDVWL